MAGGGSSELQELREMVDGVIAEMEARIQELEKLVPAGPRPGGGGTSGGKRASVKKSAGKKKGK